MPFSKAFIFQNERNRHPDLNLAIPKSQESETQETYIYLQKLILAFLCYFFLFISNHFIPIKAIMQLGRNVVGLQGVK